MCLKMPFLHFETSEGYDRMFEVISEIKREKEKVKPKVKVNEEKKEKEKEAWQKTRQIKDEPSKKEAEKEQAAGKGREESLTREGKSSLEDGGKGEGPGDDVGNEGFSDLLSTGEKVKARQEAFHSATNTQDELSMHLWPAPPERGPFPPGPPPPRQGGKCARELTDWMVGGLKYRSDNSVFIGSASPPLGDGSPTPKSLTSRKVPPGFVNNSLGHNQKRDKNGGQKLVHQVNNPGILDSIEIRGRDLGRC